MPFAFVAAMGGVGFEDVAVAGFQLFDYTGLIDRSGTDIVSQRTEKNRVFAILRIHGAELLQIFYAGEHRLHSRSMDDAVETALRAGFYDHIRSKVCVSTDEESQIS